jgi:hypothetical protein
MYIALKDIKVQVIAEDGSRSIEIRKKGQPVPEAATWKNPGPWIRRGEITDEDGTVWKGGLNTGMKLVPAGADQVTIEVPVGHAPVDPPSSTVASAVAEAMTVAIPATDENAQALSEMRAVVPAPDDSDLDTAFRNCQGLMHDPKAPFLDPDVAEAINKTAKPKIPTIEEILEAGYTEREAVGIIARQTALASGKSEEESNAAHFAAMEAYDESQPTKPMPFESLSEKSKAAIVDFDQEHGTTYSVDVVQPETPETIDPALPPPVLEQAEEPETPEVIEDEWSDDRLGPAPEVAPEPETEPEPDPEPEPEVPPPDPPAAQPKLSRKKLSAMTKPELVEIGKGLGVKLPSYTRKGAMIKKILDAQG